MWPASFWEKYEYFIRHSAGLGKSPTKPDTDIYDHKYVHCDVLVIGAGISGIMAAKTAAKNNFKTILLDEKAEIGGTTIYQDSDNFSSKYFYDITVGNYLFPLKHFKLILKSWFVFGSYSSF